MPSGRGRFLPYVSLLLGIFRPLPFPNTFVRRFWLFSHRTIGDGAIVIAWIQIWESVSTLTATEESNPAALLQGLSLAFQRLTAQAAHPVLGAPVGCMS